MKFNVQLKDQLRQYEKIEAAKSGALNAQIREVDAQSQPTIPRYWQSEGVVSGVIRWKPIDRAAAMLLAKAPWWAHPVDMPPAKSTPESKPNKPKRKRKHMKGAIRESGGTIQHEDIPHNGKYISNAGLTITMANGKALFDEGELYALIVEQISKLPAETRPNVLAAQDARKIITELLYGIGGEMDKFNASSKTYLEDIRQTRFAVVSETATMTKELKDVRQFFLGSDYSEQIARLREFVDLCERLHKLKQSGFLDSVADTMLRLAERQ